MCQFCGKCGKMPVKSCSPMEHVVKSAAGQMKSVQGKAHHMRRNVKFMRVSREKAKVMRVNQEKEKLMHLKRCGTNHDEKRKAKLVRLKRNGVCRDEKQEKAKHVRVSHVHDGGKTAQDNGKCMHLHLYVNMI